MSKLSDELEHFFEWLKRGETETVRHYLETQKIGLQRQAESLESSLETANKRIAELEKQSLERFTLELEPLEKQTVEKIIAGADEPINIFALKGALQKLLRRFTEEEIRKAMPMEYCGHCCGAYLCDNDCPIIEKLKEGRNGK